MTSCRYAVGPAPGLPTAGTPSLAGRRTALLSVVGAAAILSSSFTLTKVVLLDVPPLTIGFIRFAVAALVLAGWVHLVRRYPRPQRGDQWLLALGGLLGITLYFSVENIGVDLATATDAALLVASYPAITALLELLIYRRRTSLRALAGIALAVLGVYVVVGYSPGAGPGRRIGDVLLIASGIVWALYNFVTRTVANRYPTPVILYYQARVGAVGFLPLAMLEHLRWHLPTNAGNTVACLAALALLCSIAGLGLYAKGLQQLSPTTAVNLLNLVPVFGLVIALIVIREQITILQIVGGLIVILGVSLSARQQPTQRPR